MVIHFREFVRGCDCKESVAPNFRMQAGVGERVQTEQPFQKLYIDFLGKYPRSKKGYDWIIFSKFTFIKAMKEASSSNVVDSP